jgi:hypothetical protein
MSPRRSGGIEPEQRRRRAHANELMLAVAMRLLGEARLAGAFPTGDGAMAPFVARIAPELQGDEHVTEDGEGWLELPRSDYKVVIGEPEDDEIRLSCRYGWHSIGGRLRIDGVFGEVLYGMGTSFDDPEQRIERSPLEEEVMSRALARMNEEGGRKGGGRERAAFFGEEFLRALAVWPQPGAVAQILAVDLHGDGLVIHHTYDDPVEARATIPLVFYELAEVEPPFEELLAEAEAEGGNLAPNISVTDDIGTRYVNAGGGEGGVEVAHGETYFTPAVPAEATRLIVSSYAGTVEVDL